MWLGLPLQAVGVQQPVHVVAVLTDGVLHASDVQPADYHAEELGGNTEASAC